MADEIIFGPWIGAVTSTQATIKAAVAPGVSPQLVVSRNSNLSNPTQHQPTRMSVAPEMTVVTFKLNALSANQQFHYALQINGSPVTSRQGRFRTFPTEGSPASFTFACAGDAKGGQLFSSYSNHRVFEMIHDEDPLFFIHLGDLHYGDSNSSTVADHVDEYRQVLEAERQALLYRNVPLAYTWDDHDYCGNASDSRSTGRRAARLAYQRCVPHYPLVEAGGVDGEHDVAIYQEPFTVGRVRFIITDTRSERSDRTAADSAAKTILGAHQKQWLKETLFEGKEQFRLQVWVSSVPWIGNPDVDGEDSDPWFSYATERAEIGDFIHNNGIRNLLMLCADSHMIALDDGSNNRGATGAGGFPTFCASPLDRSNSIKGQPYSHGTFATHRGQYGLISITDNGGATVQVTITGKHENTPLVTLAFDSPMA